MKAGSPVDTVTMDVRLASSRGAQALFAFLAWACVAVAAQAQSATAPQARPSAGNVASAPRAATDPRAPNRRTSPYRQQKVTEKARKYYVGAWGIDKMRVSSTSSGNLIRFSYRVSDAELAKALSSRADTPVMLGLRSRAVLQVPVMDKVGPLRQATTPKVGQEYWMVFSNKGNLVKPGDRVNVIIGQFHADGLMVE
jgi:hypothetical protein